MGFWSRLFGRKAAAPQAPVPGAPTPPPTAPNVIDPREHLLKAVEAQLLADPAVEKVERHPELYGLHVTREGTQGTLFLDNLFQDTREMGEDERAQVIQRFIQMMRWQGGARALPWDEARERLLPVLRLSTFGKGQLNPGHEPGREVVGRPSLPFLRELLVLDLPESTLYIQRRDLEAWGVSDEEAFTAARAHLARIHDQGVELYDRAPSPIWSVDSNDTYEASRLLHPGFLASFAGRVEGRPIAIIPERSTLLIAGDAHPDTVARLCESAEREYQAASRRISPVLYSVDDAGRVVPYLRPGDDALAQRVRMAHVRLALAEYRVQKETLDKQHEETGEGPFVASLSALARDKDGRPLTYCVWGLDVDSLLPEADLVALHLGGEDIFMVPWETVRRIAGEYLAPVPELWPPRHRTLAWPPPDVLERLRAEERDIENYEGP